MKSILQKEKACFVCGVEYGLEKHHCIFGTSNRKNSEKYGLTVWLCRRHHTGDSTGNRAAVHFNKTLDTRIKQTAQRAFEKEYPTLDFLKIFGRNYL